MKKAKEDNFRNRVSNVTEAEVEDQLLRTSLDKFTKDNNTSPDFARSYKR